MTTDNQPKYEELKKALDDLAKTVGVFGAEIESREKLVLLRRQKTTWVGVDENKLRFAIDNALREYT